MCVHVQGVNRQIVSRQIERLEDFFQCKVFAISVNDDFLLPSAPWSLLNHYTTAYIWRFLELRLDESQKMLLVHAGRVVDVRVDFSDVVEVTGISDRESWPNNPLTDEARPVA